MFDVASSVFTYLALQNRFGGWDCGSRKGTRRGWACPTAPITCEPGSVDSVPSVGSITLAVLAL